MTTTTARGGILIKKLYIDFLEAYNGDEPENYFPYIHLFPGYVCEFFPGKMILPKLITVCVCVSVGVPGSDCDVYTIANNLNQDCRCQL